jgi:hypothetical protein
VLERFEHIVRFIHPGKRLGSTFYNSGLSSQDTSWKQVLNDDLCKMTQTSGSCPLF